MALTGSMRDFGLSEILQLIGHQKKSGVLEVTDKTRRVEILFDQGNIVAAKHDPYDERYDLGAMLTRSGLISRSQLAAARKEERESLKPIEQVLLNARAVKVEELKSMRTLAQLETIYALFLWKAGDYSFEQSAVSYPQQFTTPISSEQVLMDGYRIKDEWPLIEKTIPDTRMKLSRLEGGSKLKGDYDKLLALVDGDRTAEDIVFLARASRFETLKSLRELIEAGQVEGIGTEAVASTRDVGAMLYRGLVVAVAVAGLAGAILGINVNLGRLGNHDLTNAGTRAAIMLQAVYRGDQVERALAIHAATTGSYPKKLEELVTAGELDAAALSGPAAFNYEGGGPEYKLTLAPPK